MDCGVERSGDKVLPIRRASNGRYDVCMGLYRFANCSTLEPENKCHTDLVSEDTSVDFCVGIPDLNGGGIRCRYDVLPIGRVYIRLKKVSVPLRRLANCSASAGIPDLNRPDPEMICCPLGE